MTNEIVRATDISPVVKLVTDTVRSIHTKQAYGRALTDFLTWYTDTDQHQLKRMTVLAYMTHLQEQHKPASMINQRLSAIRKLAREAADNGFIDEASAQAIKRIPNIEQTGQRLGNWLSNPQAQSLLDAPNADTLKGARDRALLAVLLGCGLRRAEAASLTFAHIQQREGRWVIVDLLGKRNKLRSIGLPAFAKVALDAWAQKLGEHSGFIFRPLQKGDRIMLGHMTPQAVFDVVSKYAAQIGADVRTHDLRRTYAKLTHKGKSPIEQIQLSLGHESIQTTERYLGVRQDLQNAPCDVLDLHV